MDIFLDRYNKKFLEYAKKAEKRALAQSQKVETGQIDKFDPNFAFNNFTAQKLEKSVAVKTNEIRSKQQEIISYKENSLRLDSAVKMVEKMESLANAALASENATQRQSHATNAAALWNEIEAILTSSTAGAPAFFENEISQAYQSLTAQPNQFANPSFEDITNGVGGGRIPIGWSGSSSGIGTNAGGGLRVSDGTYSVPIGGWSNSAGGYIEQTTSANIDSVYELSFDAGVNFGSATGTLLVEVMDGATPILSETILDDATSTGLDSYTYNFTATGTNLTTRFTLLNQTNSSLDFDIDNTSLVETHRLITNAPANTLKGKSEYTKLDTSFGWQNASIATWAGDNDIETDKLNFANLKQTLQSYANTVSTHVAIEEASIENMKKQIDLSQTEQKALLSLDDNEQAVQLQKAYMQVNLSQELLAKMLNYNTSLFNLFNFK